MKTYLSNSGEFEAEELKPCPFCGGEADLSFIGNDYTKSRKVTIKCKGCRAKRTDAALRYSHEWVARVAIDYWNKRK